MCNDNFFHGGIVFPSFTGMSCCNPCCNDGSVEAEWVESNNNRCCRRCCCQCCCQCCCNRCNNGCVGGTSDNNCSCNGNVGGMSDDDCRHHHCCDESIGGIFDDDDDCRCRDHNRRRW